MNKYYAFIGDIHSQLTPALKAVDYCYRKGLTPIFLGDLFDSRTYTSETVEVWELVKQTQTDLNAVVLMSNHQDKLRRWLVGNPVDLSRSPELQRSILEFGEGQVNLQELNNWLHSLPYGFVFKDQNDLEYRACHAFFSELIRIPKKVGNRGFLVGFEHITRLTRNWMLYGNKTSDNRRIHWWEDPNPFDWVRVAGHYHTVFIDIPGKKLVLDANCGNPGGKLGLYEVESKTLVLF
jgi:hypothetical protein